MADTAAPDVLSVLQKTFTDYGLGSLWTKVMDLVRQGWDASNMDAFLVQLQETPEYKERFKANEARIKAGLNPLTPSEYVKLESTYRGIMQDAGLTRPGFYDKNSDFQSLIANDISAAEMQQRVSDAVDATFKADPDTRKALQEYYGVGPDGVAAFFLDPEKARTVLEQQYSAANFTGIASQLGVGVDKSTAELAAQSGVIGVGNSQMARQGLSQVASESAALANLGAVYGDQMTDAENVQATFDIGAGAGKASEKKKKLASRERAAFSGSSAAGQGSLGGSTAGQI